MKIAYDAVVSRYTALEAELAVLQKEKERRIHWQGLAYKGMNLVDKILQNHLGTGTTEIDFPADCERAFDMIITLRERTWTETKDENKLPEMGERVLILRKGRVSIARRGTLARTGEVVWSFDRGWECTPDEVTHYMPLPELPK